MSLGLGALITGVSACAKGSASVRTRGGLAEQLVAGENILIKGMTFSQDLDFSEILEAAVTGTDLYQAWCASNLVFENCTFRGSVGGSKDLDTGMQSTFFTRNVTFVHCNFEEEVRFRKCTFAGEVRFISNTFYKEAHFEEASFRGQATFQNNHFFEDARFQNAVFHEPVTFYKSLFHRNAAFQGCRFNDHAQWSLVQILGYGDFTVTEFDRDFIFNYAECPGRLVFDHSFFRKRADMIELKARDLSMRFCAFGELKMKGSQVTGTLSSEGSYFLSREPVADFTASGLSRE